MQRPPVVPPPSTREGRRVATLRAILWYMLGVSAVFALAIELLLPQNRMRGLVLLLSVGGTCLIGMALLARGKVKTAGIGYLLLMWVIVSSLAITGGGVSSPAFAGFMCLALTGGLLFGMKGGVVMTALCLAAEAGIIFAGAWGLLPPSQVKHTPGTLAITHAIFLGWVGLIVVQYSRAIEAAAYNLGERVKELTALHAAAQALHDTKTGLREVLETFARLIPSAYQFPLHATARIRIGEMEATTWGFRRSTLMQRADFTTPDGLPGSIEVSYAGEFPGNARAPFLPEEQVLLNTLADMLRAASERRKADSALRESEARLRELFDTARDTIYHLSPQGTIVLLNPAFEAVTGWKRDEWTGRHFGELIHPEDLPRAVEYFRRAMAGRESPLYEVRVRTKAGGYVKAEFLGVPRRAENKVVGVLGVARDVTERRGLEEQAHRAQRLDSIGALAGGIAHDLNNILTPILLASEMLEKRVEDERGKGMAASIASSARRGSEIVKQILTFARGGAGGARAQQLRHLAREMETFVRETFPRGIEIRFDVARDLPPVMGDATQIHQVLLNLCVNARDAMPDGGRLVVTAAVERVAAADEDAMPGGDYVVLSVEDSGNGIPPEIRSRIFEPFFTTKEEGRGTGLGLSSTLSIVRAHGGFIRLSSEAGRGSVFRVFLPVAAGAATEAPKERFAAAGKGETILVIDDEQASLFFIREILEANGYLVRIARDGMEGLMKLEEAGSPVKLAISDVEMPRMNGIEFAGKLRALHPDTRILLTSGNPAVGEQAHGLPSDAFLPKPYTANELLGRVWKLLRD